MGHRDPAKPDLPDINLVTRGIFPENTCRNNGWESAKCN